MSKEKQLISLIESLEKREFDELINIYLHNEYGFKKIVFTDGKDDTGLDIKVFDYSGEKLQYQLTTQRSTSQRELKQFEHKLKEDFEKAKENHKDYHYKDRLIYFYSYRLTNEKVRNYEKTAFKDYGITLDLMEAKRLAQESENIIEMQSFLYKIAELDTFHVSNSTFDNTLFFDLLSFGKPTEFKTQVIDAFILQLFYQEGSLSIEKIQGACEQQFNVKENHVFYERALSKFMTDKRIVKNKTNGDYLLSDIEFQTLKLQNENFALAKTVFLKEVKQILDENMQGDFLDEYVQELKRLYVENFELDLKEVIENNEEFHLFGMFKSFIKFIEKRGKSEDEAKALAHKLLAYCLNNKFIQKVAATKVYSSKIDNRRLSTYLTNKKKLFVDTPIALYALCHYYRPKTEFRNYFFKATRNLLEYSRSEKVTLYISERYLWEIQNNVNEARGLVPFTKIPHFEMLGSSTNIFFSFFLQLKELREVEADLTFEQFLNEFEWGTGASQTSILSSIEHALAQKNICKQVLPHYEIDEANKVFESAIDKYSKSKTAFARVNDSIMLAYLSDSNVELHPLQPLFLTWDKTFFESHTHFLKKFPTAQRWLIMTPNKFVDVYALLKFSINSETVTENLLALISDNIVEETHSLIDSLALILNPENDVSLEYINRIRQIREKEVNKVSAEFGGYAEQTEGGPTAIDEIFYKLTHHYRDSKFEALKSLFTREDVMDRVITVLKQLIEEFRESRQIADTSLFSAFDELLTTDTAS